VIPTDNLTLITAALAAAGVVGAVRRWYRASEERFSALFRHPRRSSGPKRVAAERWTSG